MKNNGTILDVRTAEEFRAGNVPGSVNIPLQEIALRINELKMLEAPLLICCASGTRSGIAAQYIAGHGIECSNAGSWADLNSKALNSL